MLKVIDTFSTIGPTPIVEYIIDSGPGYVYNLASGAGPVVNQGTLKFTTGQQVIALLSEPGGPNLELDPTKRWEFEIKVDRNSQGGFAVWFDGATKTGWVVMITKSSSGWRYYVQEVLSTERVTRQYKDIVNPPEYPYDFRVAWEPVADGVGGEVIGFLNGGQITDPFFLVPEHHQMGLHGNRDTELAKPFRVEQV